MTDVSSFLTMVRLDCVGYFRGAIGIGDLNAARTSKDVVTRCYDFFDSIGYTLRLVA